MLTKQDWRDIWHALALAKMKTERTQDHKLDARLNTLLLKIGIHGQIGLAWTQRMQAQVYVNFNEDKG